MPTTRQSRLLDQAPRCRHRAVEGVSDSRRDWLVGADPIKDGPLDPVQQKLLFDDVTPELDEAVGKLCETRGLVRTRRSGCVTFASVRAGPVGAPSTYDGHGTVTCSGGH
jgi:hypothetical protein